MSTPSKPSPVQLGTIRVVDPHEVWPDEAKDFTPWLFDNFGQLSAALGIEISAKEAERKVGNYVLDIYAEDEATGKAVVVENQLEETDHKHLGQLIAYASGLEAGTVVWVTPKVRDEHLSAIDWLNKVSNEPVSFFLVRIEVIQIDKSPFAVQFFVEGKPSWWKRALGGIKEPLVRPVTMTWQDDPGQSIPVVFWKEAFWKTLERAAQEGILLKTLPIKKTTDQAEADEFLSPRYFNPQGLAL